ncbi:nSTAND1 domain-containing NTPase [Nostoc sp. 'Lobaria pulmonaria (5183) cyanobiont']|uniref:WD40 domain-containing protein n=1 Tax=Nostoc sp. 'Lobaria pulmonaria (5183) cyanobiont' TaxID=1618022 RepID=UPI000CF362D0|nr:ribosome assembly protein 4 [Nostoc sp. 'Lobaria pulmonaria (5183) cyanobiont']AVH72605.1 WD40 repeat-containing protein [Nostoc sp. 'Lobaria pulmonaria (5183) cyanobiont']
MTDSQQPENEKGLQQLAWAIESSVGQFKLILARCNYARERDRLISKLQEICQVEIRVLAVQQSRKTLYTAIQSEFGAEIPACVMVVGLESVQNLSVMLTSANQVREEFRKNFAFPLVLWIDDEIYKQLIQLAPDLESWATTRNFAISTQQLVAFIIETANQWFSNNLKFSVDVYIKLETELETAQRELLNQPDIYNLEIQADLESLLGFIKQINNQKDLALQHYQKAYKLWQESNNLERQAIILGEIGVGYYLKAFKNPDINHPDWQTAWYYIREYINFINLFHNPDLIANTAIKFGDILRDLQKWETLQSLSEQALVVHQTNNQPRELAKDYGFLAEVALAQNNWVKANQLVQQALEVFAAIPNLESANVSGVLSDIPERVLKSKHLSLYQFILSRSQYHLGQIKQATFSLETARHVGNPLEDFRLYLDILKFLQQLYFEQKEYLKAYKIKQQRRSIEQQFGLRAFIGAGRLEATKQAFVETLRSNSPQGNIAPEIAASGRLLDVERLIERMGRPDYKLIVIHGQSGVGKSSLVNAGLIPALKNKAIGTQDYLPVVMRVYTNWVEELGKLLGNGGDEEELELQVSTLEAQRSTFELGISTSEAQPSTFELGTSTSEAQRSTSEAQRSTSEAQRSTSEAQPSTSEPQRSTSEAQRSTSEPQRSTSELETLQYSSAIQSEPHPVFADANTPLSLARRGVGGEVREPQYLISRLKENEQRNLRTVLIFDQFEEFFFVYTEPAQRKQFFEFLGECLNVLSVKVILSLRVDYIHYLLECNDLSSLKIIGNDILSNNVLYKLGNFSPADAKSIIQRLTENTSFHLEDVLVEQLVQDLAGELGEVRPIELQVVGAQLQTENITTLAEYRQRGTKDELVKRYLHEVVNDCGEENHQAADILLYLLTDEKGTRPLKTRAELERDLFAYFLEIPPTPLKKGGFILSTPFLRGSPQAGGSETREDKAFDISKLDLIVEIFVQSGLVVLLPENPADRYQLVHDYIAAFIRQQQEPKLKHVMAELEKEREQRKLSDAKLNNFLKRALFGSVAAGLVLAGLAVTAWDAARTADEQRKQAAISEINALANSSEAFFVSKQNPDALIEGLKAGGKLKKLKLNPGANTDTQMRTMAMLRQAIYLQPQEHKENRAIEVNTLEGHSSSVWGVVFSPDGKTLASGSDDNTIKLWDVSTGKAIKTLTGHSSMVISVVFSPDGKTLASGSDDNTIKLWDVSTGKAIKTLTGHSSMVISVVFSPDGKTLASGSDDNTIKLWDVSTGKAIKTLTGHSSRVLSVVFSPDGKTLASGSDDKTIKLWDVSTGKASKTLTGHSSTVWGVVFSPDGKTLASGSDDKTIKLWDVSTGKASKTLTGHSSRVLSVVFSPDGKTLASGSYDKTIKLWDVSTGKASKTLTGHSSWVLSVVFSPDGKTLASGSDDKTIKLWDVSTGKAIKTLTGHSSTVISVVFSPDGKTLASGSDDKTIKLWDVSTDKAIKTLTGHSSTVYSVVFSPDGKTLASGSDDKTIKLWDVSTGKAIKTLTGHSSTVYSVVFSPDGKTLASGSDDKTIKLWDVSTGKASKTLTGHSSTVYSVVFSPDGKTLASGSDDNTIKFWDVSTGKAIKTLTGHSSRVISVVFSPDGKTLASGSDDKTIKLWDVSTGKAIKTLTGHSSTVISVVFSPDGKTLASGSDDKTVILWDLDLDNLLLSGCNLLNNYLVAHPEVLEELQSCQTPSQKALGATVLVIQGEKLARNNDINGAVEKFRQAQQWDNKLNFDFQSRAKQFVNKGKAERSVDEGNSRLQEKKFKEALADYTEALKLDPKVEIPISSWNALCWDGSLQKQAADVLPACEQAVAFAPKNGNIRDSRGLARALTGNTQGAIQDFEAYIAQSDDKDRKAQRQRWVKDLRAGKNPFTDAELKKLQN